MEAVTHVSHAMESVTHVTHVSRSHGGWTHKVASRLASLVHIPDPQTQVRSKAA